MKISFPFAEIIEQLYLSDPTKMFNVQFITILECMHRSGEAAFLEEPIKQV